MTDPEVLAILEQLAPLLEAPLDEANGPAIAQWHEAFKQGVAQAERGPRWPEVQARAQVLGRLLNRRMALIQAAQDALKQELDKVGAGRVALAAYRARP